MLAGAPYTPNRSPPTRATTASWANSACNRWATALSTASPKWASSTLLMSAKPSKSSRASTPCGYCWASSAATMALRWQAHQVITERQSVDVQVQLQFFKGHRGIADKHLQQALLQGVRRHLQCRTRGRHRQHHTMGTGNKQMHCLGIKAM